MGMDPTGHIVVSTALFIGTIIVGAAIGGGTAAYSSFKKGDEWYEIVLKTLSGAALGGMLGASMGIGASIAAGATFGALSTGASVAVGLGISVGGSAILGAANSFINQSIDNDWDMSAINGGRISSDALVAGIKGLLSFGTGAWTGAGGMWDIPKGNAPGVFNLVYRSCLNGIIGGSWKMSVDAVYSYILGEECGWISFLKKLKE